MHKNPLSPAGVMIFLLWNDKYFLILRDDKPEIQNPNTWCPVTGGVEEGENFLDTISRELIEEIHVIINNIKILGVSVKGNCFFFGRMTDCEASQIVLGEGQRYDFFTYEQLADLDIRGAFGIYLSKYPDVFRRMSEEDYEPSASDFNLAQWDNQTLKTL